VLISKNQSIVNLFLDYNFFDSIWHSIYKWLLGITTIKPDDIYSRACTI